LKPCAIIVGKQRTKSPHTPLLKRGELVAIVW
jgi:hypothetical protein